MKKILLFAFCIPISICYGQVTISQSDMPSSGDSFETDNGGTGIGLDLSTTGANVTWDFSTLNLNPADTLQFQSVGSTPIAYQFYFNNAFLYPNHKADVAQAVADFPIPSQVPITITDVINFYKSSSSEYTQTGFGANISGLPSSIRYIPTDKIYELPLQFNDSYTGDFAWNISVPTIGYYGQNKTRTTVVDGWGTLVLPYGNTFPALRIKHTISGVDTFYLDAVGFGFALPSTNIEYKWLTPGYGIPVMQVNAIDLFGVETPNSVVTKHLPAPSAIQNSFVKQMDLSFQNPVANQAQIQLNTTTNIPVSIQLVDASGKLVCHQMENAIQTGANRFILNLDGISNGYYNLIVTQGDFRGQGKLIVAQ